MKPSLIALCAALLVSCATNVPRTPSATYTAPPRASAVAPTAEAVRVDNAATGVVSAKLEGQVAGLQRTTANLSDGMKAALAEVGKLRAAKAATEAQLDDLFILMDATAAKVKDLLADVAAAQASAQEQQRLRVKAETNLAALSTAAAARDAETISLRGQREDLSKLNASMGTENDKLRARVTTAEKSAAVGSYLKWVIGIGLLLIFVTACGLVYLKFLMPVKL